MKNIDGLEFIGVASGSGVSARHVAEKFGFSHCASNESEVLDDSNINTVVIATRHNAHARQVISALQAGKHVFCEKPLCISETELADVVRCRYHNQSPRLMVGFNRRFSPLALRMKQFFANAGETLSLNYRVNAGYIPASHWTQDPDQGGGRLIGEVCHFVDFVSFVTASTPVSVFAAPLRDDGRYCEDNLHLVLPFENGSVASITYLSNGDKAIAKERVEVFAGGSVAVLDDFHSLELIRDGKRERISSKLRQDKGHRQEWEVFAHSIQQGTPSPIDFQSIVATTLATFKALDSVRTGRPIPINTDQFISSALGDA
jgi:predicted dehydrogenase